jgi:uncharacterized protein
MLPEDLRFFLIEMNIKQKYGGTALVAGASEGIGAAFATLLATEGLDLVLVARRPAQLEQLAVVLRSRHNINVKCISRDLAEPEAMRDITEALEGKDINVLVYNAAAPYIGHFINSSAEHRARMVSVNIISPLNMVHDFGERMLARGGGAIVLMSSLAGFQGSGYLSLYAATKAFNRILAESLWYEWKNSGVDIIACCAGATGTPNYRSSNPEKTGFFTPRVLAPEEVAGECFRKLGKLPSFIPGRGNRIASFIMQNLLPRKTAINIMGDTTRKMYRL